MKGGGIPRVAVPFSVRRAQLNAVAAGPDAAKRALGELTEGPFLCVHVGAEGAD
jgi:hypothetical protein